MMREPQVLIPFDRREAISCATAAKIAGKSTGTIKNWAATYYIGRRVAGGPWLISRVALQMLLDGNERALNAYLAGDRRGDLVKVYFQKV